MILKYMGEYAWVTYKYYAIFYKGFGQPQILVLQRRRVLVPIFCGYQGMTVLNISPCKLFRLTVFSISDNSSSVLRGGQTPTLNIV